ncbi:MAG TPA: lycopene cyclase family protein [Solirubrobacterales bacterium]|nr:lycopene cyclase family protein [Solirubrobacterales bacterium]
MPTRATKRGDERRPLSGSCDVLICGASFAGLAVARELTGSGAEVMVVDRYEIGERATSACGIPTDWLQAMGLMAAERQRFDSLLVHTPYGTRRYRLPWTFSTFDYRELCALLWADCDARFETAKVNGRAAQSNGNGVIAVDTDRGVLSAPLVVDALGWRRVLASGESYQPPDAPLSRGIEVHPPGRSMEFEIWIDRRYVRAGYCWSFPAGDEVRIGVGSLDPRFPLREPVELLAEDLGRDLVHYQGGYIPHKLRPATEAGVFFVGDSAGHCMPLTAEGIRPALYYGIALGRELRGVVEGRQSRAQAAARYVDFAGVHAWKFRWLLRGQRMLPHVPPRLLGPAIRLLGWNRRLVYWIFGHYMRFAPPGLACPSPGRRQRPDEEGRNGKELRRPLREADKVG